MSSSCEPVTPVDAARAAVERAYAGGPPSGLVADLVVCVRGLCNEVERLKGENETLGEWGKGLNEKLIACEDGCEKEVLAERAKVAELERRVKDCEAAMWTTVSRLSGFDDNVVVSGAVKYLDRVVRGEATT